MRALDRIRPWVGEIVSAWLDCLAPGWCRQCGADIPCARDAFCAPCLEAIRWIAGACARCGTPVLRPATETSGCRPPPCGACMPLGLRFDLAAAGGEYRGALRTAVLRHKFHADPGVAPVLVDALRRAAASAPLAPSVERAGAVVPVPVHPLKRWWRGRDPVGELARLAAPALRSAGIPVVPLLSKVRWTHSQVSLPEAARRRNLRGAFRVRKGARVPPVVVLLDDVLTTGTTASECASALRRGGAVEILVLAAARS